MDRHDPPLLTNLLIPSFLRRREPFVAVLAAVVAVFIVATEFTIVGAQAGGGLPALAEATRGFLTVWLVEGNPASAVERFVSRTLNDERFVPAEWFSPEEYQRKFNRDARRQPHTISADEFNRRMTEYLSSLRPPVGPGRSGQPEAPGRGGRGQALTLQSVLRPFSVAGLKGLSDLDELLREREPTDLTGLPAITYGVRRWADISWTASGTVGFRSALADRTKQTGAEVRAVVVRLISPPGDEAPGLLFMLWGDESRSKDGWRLWGVEPVPMD